MEFLISLVDSPNKAREIDFSVSMAEDWPDYIYVSRHAAATVCTSPALAGWEPAIIAETFRIYGRTERTNPAGRRIYACEA
jgi:hypothetical protein